MANNNKSDRVQTDISVRPGQKRDVRLSSSIWPVRQAGQYSPIGDAGKSRKVKVASGKECDYPMCRHRNSHSRPDCRLAKAHERDRIVVKQKP